MTEESEPVACYRDQRKQDEWMSSSFKVDCIALIHEAQATDAPQRKTVITSKILKHGNKQNPFVPP